MSEFDTGALVVDIHAAMVAAGKHFTLAASAMTVCGETGEMVEALRRYIGMARRAGSIEEMRDELADVELSSFMFTAVGGGLDALQRLVAHWEDSEPWDLTYEEAALVVADAAGQFAHWFLNGTAYDAYQKLALVIERNRRLAALLGVDLPAAVEAKAAVIMARGFGAHQGVPA
ncbi:MAG TPA: hypothetical protein VJ851_00770 [Jatrophihabitans sp.]|nr:hypothetical protein [Jatrophihabitans sp.]